MDPVPTALLQPWYSLVREKRGTRQEFLKAIVKALDVDVSSIGTSQVRKGIGAERFVLVLMGTVLGIVGFHSLYGGKPFGVGV